MECGSDLFCTLDIALPLQIGVTKFSDIWEIGIQCISSRKNVNEPADENYTLYIERDGENACKSVM